MREKLASIGDDFWIDDESGRHALDVDGTALQARKTMKSEDAPGRELARTQERWLRVKETMVIEDAGGQHR